MTDKIYPRFQRYEDFPGLTEDQINSEGTQAFIDNNPHYFACEENFKLLEAWLNLHGELPFTRLNLEIAQRDLEADGILRHAPVAVTTPPNNWSSVVLSRADALAEYQPSASETAQLEKLSDDPALGDRARKNRDAKLRLLAGQQRREMSKVVKP